MREWSKERRRVVHPGGGEMRTKQSDALASDVNSILDSWLKRGTVNVPMQRPAYGDFSNVDDYLSAVMKLQEADREFSALPAHVRKHVQNDPAEFLRVCMDPDRRNELVELGLVEEQLPLLSPDTEPVPEPAPEPAPEPTPAPGSP